jgi:hypothetical protein
MPLARIVTWLAEDTDALAKDLRARGFEVVTKSPDEISSEPADLEITVEECASEEALTSASGIALTQDKCVFIAPGAIVENPRPVPVIPLSVMTRQPEPELADDFVQPVESNELEPLAAIHQLEDQSENLEQAPVLDVAETVVDFSAAVAEPEVSGFALETVFDPQVVAPRVEELAEPPSEITEPLAEEEELVAHEYFSSVESFPTSISEPVLEVPLAGAEIDPGEYAETPPEATVEVPAILEAQPVFQVETEAISQNQLEAIVEAGALVEEVWLVETQVVSKTQPETRVEAEAVWEMQPEAVMETPAFLQADVSLTETEPTSDWPIWHPLAEPEVLAVSQSMVKEPVLAAPLTSRNKIVFNEQIPQVVPLMQNAVPVRPNTYRQRILQKRVVQNDEVFWKTATVLAMVAVAALLVGVSANRFSPLPANVQRSMEAQQPVPFEKARIVPALSLDAGNKMGATGLPPAHGSDVVRFQPALAVEPAAPKIVPESRADRLVRVKPRRHSAGQPESDMVAEDTVVRYNKKHPPASHTQAQKNSGVKQYTDLD